MSAESPFARLYIFPVGIADITPAEGPQAMIAPMGGASVGQVETRYVDLPAPVRLDRGGELHPVRVAYETYGTLSADRDNVILVCHALSGDAHAAGVSTTSAESTRDG